MLRDRQTCESSLSPPSPLRRGRPAGRPWPLVSSHRMRLCGRCGELKQDEDFAWRRKARGQRQTYCRQCQAAYNHEHYLANKQLYVDRARARKQELRVQRTRFLLEYFASHPCADCGEVDPIVLEFDHLGGKLFDIGTALPCQSWANILAEIEKCEVVCANCHRRRTKRRQGAMRVILSEE